MAWRSHKDCSRVNWGREEETQNQNDTKVGCLQRIADATELMAKNYAALVDERDRYKRWWEDEKIRRQSRDRTICALRGFITRLKRKISAV